MNREDGGIMIGVAALVRVRDDGARVFLVEKLANAIGQRHEVIYRLLIDDLEAGRPHIRRFACRQGRDQFGTARRSIIGECRESICRGIFPVARRTIRHMHEQRIVKPAKLRAEPDRLVVGMGRDNNDPFVDSLARYELPKDLIACAHPVAAMPSRAGLGAKPAPARQ